MAQSVFAHLPLDYLPRCLDGLRPRMAIGGRFYATFFTAPEGVAERAHEPGGITTYADRDPFHFTVEQIVDTAHGCGWITRWIGDWRHPRDQQMCAFYPPV